MNSVNICWISFREVRTNALTIDTIQLELKKVVAKHLTYLKDYGLDINHLVSYQAWKGNDVCIGVNFRDSEAVSIAMLKGIMEEPGVGKGTRMLGVMADTVDNPRLRLGQDYEFTYDTWYFGTGEHKPR